MAYDFGTEGEENTKLGQRGAGKNMQMMRQGIGASKPGETACQPLSESEM
jgi:hypothetical protein